MEILNSPESIRNFADKFNASIPNSEVRMDGNRILDKLTSNPDFMFFMNLAKDLRDFLIKKLIEDSDKTIDSNVINTSLLRGKINGLEAMFSLIEKAKNEIKKFSERESKKEVLNAV